MPDLLGWIAETKRTYASLAVPISDLGVVGLSGVYPPELLRRAATVITADPFPYPPLDALGAPELAYWDHVTLVGLNYSGLIFVRSGKECPGLFFHELVHVIQGDTLGEGRYLLAYAASLATNSYGGNPFEETAYRLEADFEAGRVSPEVVSVIQGEAREACARILGDPGWAA